MGFVFNAIADVFGADDSSSQANAQIIADPPPVVAPPPPPPDPVPAAPAPTPPPAPAPKPAPPAPAPTQPDTSRAMANAAQEQRQISGRAATIYTSPEGLLGKPKTSRSAETLLGGG